MMETESIDVRRWKLRKLVRGDVQAELDMGWVTLGFSCVGSRIKNLFWVGLDYVLFSGLDCNFYYASFNYFSRFPRQRQ